MKTKIFNSWQIKKVAELIVKGEIVAFPTETVYGLGADALNAEAVKKIFTAKGRQTDNPLIVHISELKQISELAFITPLAEKLANKFWPGPLTIILKKKEIVPDAVTAGLKSVAIRMPKNKIALKLIKISGKPIAAPSANLSGKPSTTSFKHVYDDLNGKIAGIIKSKRSKIGLESTIVDLTSAVPIILRPGAVTFEQLKKIIPEIRTGASNSDKPKAPGMKYQHYAPNAQVVLFEPNAFSKIKEYEKSYKSFGKKIAVIDIKNLNKASKNMFKLFRKMDEKKIDCILIAGYEEKGLGMALMNRLRKAASVIVR